jgi:hypothetical protein
MKKKNLIITVSVLLVMVIGAIGFYLLSEQGDSSVPGTPAVTLGSSGFPVYQKDAAVYAVVEQYLTAQVQNDRSGMQSLLSAEHRSEWTEESYLIAESAFDLFDEIKISNLKMGIIDFQRYEGTDLSVFQMTYSVEFINGENMEAKIHLREEVGLEKNGDDWFVDRSIRSVVSDNQS